MVMNSPNGHVVKAPGAKLFMCPSGQVFSRLQAVSLQVNLSCKHMPKTAKRYERNGSRFST